MSKKKRVDLQKILADPTLKKELLLAALKLYKDCFLPKIVESTCSMEQALEKILSCEDAWRIYAKNMFVRIDQLLNSIEKKQGKGLYE